MQLQRLYGLSPCSENLEYTILKLHVFGVTTLVPPISLLILFFMPEPSTLRLIIILFEKELLAKNWKFVLFPQEIKLLMASQRHCLQDYLKNLSVIST